jgi:hypothetical protein
MNNQYLIVVILVLEGCWGQVAVNPSVGESGLAKWDAQSNTK